MLFAVCLRNNVACCIPLRDLRYLRENIHASVLNLHCTKKPHVSPADFADSRRQNPKNYQQKRSASEHAVYVNTLNLRENTSALADTTKKNISGD